MIPKMKFEISSWTIVKIILVLLAFYIIFLIRDVLALLFIVLILVATFSSTVNKWSKKITRPGAVIALILIFLAAIGLVIALIIPPLVAQTVQLWQNLPSYIDYFNRFSWIQQHIPQIKDYIYSLGTQFGSLSSSIITLTTGVIGGLVAIATGVVLFAYFLLDEHGVKRNFLSLFPETKRILADELFKKISLKAGNWMRGQLLLDLIIGVLDLIGLLIIGVPYALTLAVISALLEAIPTIGPIISGILAALIALSVSPLKAILIVAWYLLISQLENSFIVPKVMQKAVGLPPVIIILAILTGAKLYGVIGVIIAVPLTAIILVLIQEWSSIRSLVQNE